MTRGAMRIVIIAFAASVAFGQTTRVFRLTQNESKQELEEIATVLREAAEVQQVSIDEMVSSVAVVGSSNQGMGTAETVKKAVELAKKKLYSEAAPLFVRACGDGDQEACEWLGFL